MPSTSISINENKFKISYKIYNHDKQVDIIFLHGWGSNKELMQNAFMQNEVLSDFRLIFIDMPGFGQSSNDIVLDTYKYSNILDILFKKLELKKQVIVGHSFGGKVATLLNPDVLVLLSSAGIFTKKSISVLFKIYIFKILKYTGFGFLYKIFASKDVLGMDRNMYDTFKNVVDEDFSEKFSNFKNKALLFWGKDDMQTPLQSGERITKLIRKSSFFPMEGEHFFFASKDNAEQISLRIKNIL
jgi:pimeloyl-ACP methyl ester carboxylesterase